MKKVYVFDAYGTLFKVSTEIPGLKKRSVAAVNRIQELWRVRQLEYSWLMTCMGKWKDFNEVTEQALDYAMAYNNVNDPWLKEQLLSIYAAPSTFDDVIPFLKKLAEEEQQTAILSNGVEETLFEGTKVANVNKLIGQILSADKVRVYKPSRSVYNLVNQTFDCKSEDVIFFSANAWDICGASSFGFNTVWVNRSGGPFEKMDCEPDQVVSDLSEYVE
ncbi:MAG: haloacid dehalogenase type II [Cyclobacteriaceae bacterium]